MAFPSSWTQSTWFIDPANSSGLASDRNTGLTSGTPLLTWGEVIARMGTVSPYLSQVTTFTFMSSQTLNVDPVFFQPRLANGSQAILIGTLTSVGTIPINTATVTAQVRGGPGTRWQVSNMPGGTAAKMLLQDTTQNTYAFIDSLAGSVATISQPLSNSIISTVGIPTLTEASMATNDAFTVWSLPLVNLKSWRPTSSVDVGSGGANTAACAGWVQFIQVADSSGTGASAYPLISDTAVVTLSACSIQGRLHVSTLDGRSGAAYIIGCDVTGLASVILTSNQTPLFYGGILRAGTTTTGGATVYDGDVVVHTQFAIIGGNAIISAVYTDILMSVRGGQLVQQIGVVGSTVILWGSGGIVLHANGSFFNSQGGTFASQILLSGSLKFGNTNTAGYAAASNYIYGPFALTTANIDTYNGLLDPESGARFSNESITAGTVTPLTWTQTDWYLDGVNGNDANDGKTSGAPVKTIMGGIVSKWGTASPILTQTTTVHVLVGQASGLERAILTPILSGTSANFVIVGTPSNIGSTFAAGTVTQLVEGNPGNDLQIANMPVGAATGVLVFNSTRSSYAIIDSMNSTTAIMQQPFSAAVLTTASAFVGLPAGVVWSTGDTLQMSSLPILNLEVLSPVGGDGNSSFTNGTCWTQMIHIPDVSGTAGDTTFTVNPQGPQQTFSLCNIDPSIVSNAVTSRFQIIWMSCTLSGEVMLNGGFQTLYGGAIGSFGINFSDQGFFGEGGIYRETICHGPLNVFSGDLFINSLHIIGTLSVNAGAAVSFGSHPIWGAGSIQSGGVFLKVGAATWAASLLVSSIQINSNSFGYASAGQYTYGPFALTAANLDGYGGLHGGSSPQAVFSNGTNSVPTIPSSWTQTDWYLDGYAGNDTTGDGSFGNPVKTITGGIISRWGTSSPLLNQTTTIHVLTGQAANLERAVLKPILQGQNTNFVIIGTTTSLGVTFTAGTVTPKSQGNPGTDLLIATMQAGSAAGDLVFNSTRSSYAFIKSMSGSTATMEQPFTSASLTTVSLSPFGSENNAWATGDTLQRFSVPILNLEAFLPAGGDANNSFTGGMTWVQTIRIPDASGSNGSSQFSSAPVGTGVAFSICRFDASVYLDGRGSSIQSNAYAMACHFAGGLGTPDGGNAFYDCAVQGGACVQGTGIGLVLANGAQFLGDIIIDGDLNMGGEMAFLASAGGIHLTSGATMSVLGTGAAVNGPIWGAGAINIKSGNLVNLNGTWTNNLLVASAAFNNITSGYATAGNGITYGPFKITGANLDTYGGLRQLDNAASFGIVSAVPATPVSWTQATWHINGQTGNDTTGDGSSGSPFATITGGLYPRWGTDEPILAQSVTISIDGYQNLNQEFAFVRPKLTGVGAIFINGVPTNLGAAFTSSTITPEASGNPGNDWTMVVPAGAPTTNATKGVLVKNVTRTSYAWIIGVSGSTLTLTRPATAYTSTNLSTGGTYDTSWTTGDQIQYQNVPVLNLATSTPAGGSSNSTDQIDSLIQFVKIPDATGNPGFGTFQIAPVGCSFRMSQTWIDAFASASTAVGNGWGVVIAHSYMPSGITLLGSGNSGGGSSDNCGAFGGFAGSATFSVMAQDSFIQGTVVQGPLEMRGNCYIDAHVTGTMTVRNGVTRISYLATNNQVGLWGAGSLDVKPGGMITNEISNPSTQLWATILKLATLEVGSSQTGYAIAGAGVGTGIAYGPILVTAANLDTYGPLSQSGASYMDFTVHTTPVTWTQATWFIDPTNSQGTSSDNNSGLTSGAALRTWKGFISKMGGITTTQHSVASVAVTFLSSHTDNTDPVVWTPQSSNNCVLSIQGAAPTTTAAVFTLNTAKNRTAGANALLSGSFSAGAPATGMMVQNTTAAKSSRAFIYTSAGGSNWNITQPLAPQSVPTTTLAPTQINTWASTDTVNLLAPVQVNIARFEPTIIDTSATTDNYAYLYQMIVFDPGGVGKDDCYLNGSVQVQEVSFQRNAMIVPGKPIAGTSLSHSLGHINAFYQHFLMGSNGGQDNIFFVGGACASGVQMSGRFTFDGDFICGGFFGAFASTIGIGFFYLDGIVATANTGTLVTFINQLYGGHVVYGSATANWNFVDKSMGVMFSGTYTAGWTAPLFISTGVQLNGASTGHSLVSGTPDVLNGGIATTVANLDAAASSTGFGGTAFNLGRATVTNAA